MVFGILNGVLSGLGILLIGIRLMSEGLQALAGQRLSRWIGKVTNNRVLGMLTGVGVTCLVQSSSATTIMVVGFVNSGLLTLVQAIGVIMGANVGTTLSVWLMTIGLSKFGAIILGLAVFPYLFSKRERVRNIAKAVLGIGMLFFGVESMSQGLVPLRESAAVLEWFNRIDAGSYIGVLKCAMVGCLVTVILQSSYATVAITLSLVQVGLIPFPTALALVVGENIGTTLSAIIAAVGTNRNARRAAYAHVVFNLIGAVWVTSVFRIFYQPFVESLTLSLARLFDMAPQSVNGGFEQPGLGVAMGHTMFNLINVLLLLPLVGLLARLVTWLVPVLPGEAEVVAERYKPIYLDNLMLKTPTLAIEQSHKEIVAMGELNLKMLEVLGELMASDESDPVSEKRIAAWEDYMDEAQHAVVDFVSQLITHKVSKTFSLEARRQLRRADEFESVSDYVRVATKTRHRVLRSGEMLSEVEHAEIAELHRMVTEFTELVVAMIKNRRPEDATLGRKLNAAIVKVFKEARTRNLSRLAEEPSASTRSVLYSDLIGAYRRMKDHLLNLVDTMIE